MQPCSVNPDAESGSMRGLLGTPGVRAFFSVERRHGSSTHVSDVTLGITVGCCVTLVSVSVSVSVYRCARPGVSVGVSSHEFTQVHKNHEFSGTSAAVE